MLDLRRQQGLLKKGLEANCRLENDRTQTWVLKNILD